MRELVDLSNDPRFRTAAVPSANIIATPEEISRFFEMLLCGGTYEDTRVFEQRTVVRATLRQAGGQVDRILLLPVPFSMGFMLGNKNRGMLKVHRHHPAWHRALLERLEAPSLYEEFLLHLARAGLPVPSAVIDRDFSIVRETSPEVVEVLRTIYADTSAHWVRYEVCEALMDVGNNFQFWRFHHMKTVERIIGHKRGTGGSSGVAFLKKAIEQEFFPELIQVRTEIGQ